MQTALLEPIQSSKTGRVLLFDELRGLMMISMLIYHLLYDLVVIFGVKLEWYFSPATNFWQATICCTFIFIAGACCWYSRSNLKRGLRMLALALAFSLVTYFVMPDLLIVFGLLHFMAVSILLFIPLKKPLENHSPLWGMVFCILLFLITYRTASGVLTIFPGVTLQLPSVLYQTNLLFAFGFCRPDFFSSDYFPLFPYFFLFLAGAFAARLRLPGWMYKSHCHPLAFVGRKSIWIYLFHQPVLYGVLWLFFRP